jgi:uncharacterized tellurite resistance protein B-like protein
MRAYPLNSPRAASRIVALAMLADGELSKSELDALDRLEAPRQLGLPAAEMNAVVHDFCEDLLSDAQTNWADACQIDGRTLAGLMAEVDDPELRVKVLQLCAAVVEADEHVHDGEAMVLVAAVEHWGMHRAMLASAPA